MTDEEKIYFDKIQCYVSRANGHHDIYISHHFSADFRKSISLLTNTNVIDSRQKPNKKYGILIYHYDKRCPSLNDIIDLKKQLVTGGLVILGRKNRPSAFNIFHNELFSRMANEKLVQERFLTLFREPLGKLCQLNSLPGKSLINRMLAQFGTLPPNSLVYSPYVLHIYQLCDDAKLITKYRPFTSIRSRTARLFARNKITDKGYRFMIRFTFSLWHLFVYEKKIKLTIPNNSSKNKKNIVIAMTYLGMGGVERVMLNIISGIDRSKFCVHLLTTFPHSNPWHSKFNEYADYIIHIPETVREDWPRNISRLFFEEYVIKNKPDVLFITNSDVAYRATPKIRETLPGIKIYDLLHTHGTRQDNDAYLRRSMPFDKYIDKRLVIDKYLKKYYCDKYSVNKDKISVIYNGINLDETSKPQKQNDKIFKPIKDKTIISYIGRLDIDKSPMRLVDIAIKLEKQGLPVAVAVFGNGSLDYEMKSKSLKNGVLNSHIYFFGTTDNPLCVAKESDFTILTSDFEGIPMTILESMSVGTPSIAPAVGGIPEIIDNLKDGFLVDIDNKSEEEKIDTFIDVIAKASKLEKTSLNKIGLNSKKKIVKKFSRMTKIYEHLFERDEVIT